MSIDIRPIKIMLDTNIPGKNAIPLTKSLLYNPELKNISGFNDYPYFTMDVVFPFAYLNSLSYEKRVSFFFNKPEMVKIFKIYKPEILKTTGTDTETPEILTIEEKKIKESGLKTINEKKQELISIREQLKKIESEIIQKNKIEIEKNEKIYNDEISKVDSEIKTNIDKFTKYIDELSKESLNKKLDEIFKPATSLDAVNEILESKKSFDNKESMTSLYNKTINPYIKDIIAKIKELHIFFNVYVSDVDIEVLDTQFKEINSKKTSINEKIKESYKFIKSIPEIIKDFYDTLPENSIDDKVKDIEKEKTNELKIDKDKKNKNPLEKMNKAISDKVKLEETKKILEADLLNPQIENKQPIDDTNIKIEKSKQQTKNGDENVLIMLRLLFPTKYPIVGNIFSSFNSLILKNADFTLTLSDFLPSFLRTKLIEGTALYSYVKIDGKIYTITQAVWLNDIYNHKAYAELIDKFKKLKIWKDKAIGKLNDEIKTKLDKFKNNYRNGFEESDINYIKTQRKDLTELENLPSSSGSFAKEKLQTEYLTYNKTLDDFLNTVNVFQTSVDNESYDVISDNAKNMVETYKLVTKYGTNFFKTKDKFNKIIENVNRDLEDIRINEYLREKYISKPGVDLDYERDDPKYISKLKTNFKEYTEFVENIKKFRAPNMESSNYFLQNTFNEFLENREPYKNIFNFLMNPYNININPFENIKKTDIDVEDLTRFKTAKDQYHLRKNTGVTILPSAGVNDPGYEIYVQLNVIGGELNDSNKSLVDCLYQGESLGNKLEYIVNESLRNPWDINSSRMYFDITQGDAKKEIESKEKESREQEKKEQQSNKGEQQSNKGEQQSNKGEQQSNKGEQQIGGNIKYNIHTRKMRGDIIKTRKMR